MNIFKKSMIMKKEKKVDTKNQIVEFLKALFILIIFIYLFYVGWMLITTGTMMMKLSTDMMAMIK